MKTIVEFLMRKNKLFAKLSRVENKKLGTRKQIDVYFGVDTKRYYHTVIVAGQKSRLLQKDVEVFFRVNETMQTLKECTVKKKILLLRGPICARAKNSLQKAGWSVYDFS